VSRNRRDRHLCHFYLLPENDFSHYRTFWLS
jgi:hypothetical protein